MANSLTILLSCLIGRYINSATVTWKADIFSLDIVTTEQLVRADHSNDVKTTLANHSWVSLIDISANGPIYRDTVGQFRLKFTAYDSSTSYYIGTSGCISIADSEDAAKMLLQQTMMTAYYIIDGEAERGEASLLNELLHINTAKRNDLATDLLSQLTSFTIVMDAYKNTTTSPLSVNTLQVSVDYIGCSPMRTEGNWNDGFRWDTGSAPTSTDSVVIPALAGVLQLQNDVQIQSLTVVGGIIKGYHTYCPTGWSIDPQGSSAVKCYKLFETSLPYYTADNYCHAMSNINARLMQIRNRYELEVAKRLCRGRNSSSAANTQGCWIGLHDKYGSGFFDWLVGPETFEESMFLDWRRTEPNNHTISQGNTTDGERCTELIPHQYDPLLIEQGSFNDESCSIYKPFLCQMYRKTVRYTVTVTGNAVLTNGVLEGGLMTIAGTANALTYFHVLRSAGVTLESGSSTTIGKVFLEDGSSLTALAAIRTSASAGAFLGEAVSAVIAELSPFSSFPHISLLMQPLLNIDSFTILKDVTVSAELTISGTIDIAINSKLELLQGGTLSAGTLNLQGESSQLLLNGYSSKLSTYDAFELVVANRGKYMGEYYGTDGGEAEFRYLRDPSTAQGVYRLQTTDEAGSVEITECIPYNATEAQLKNSLDALPSVSARGGTTIRRYGDAQNIRFKYGYTYRIEMDAPDSSVFSEGPLDVSFNCYGTDPTCGCADSKIPILSGISGKTECLESEYRSLVDPFVCTLTPDVAVSRISSLHSIATSGRGSIVITDGVHRLPWKSVVTINCMSGIGVVGANEIEWFSIQSREVGRMVLAGTGWVAWDSSYLLYQPDWVYGRGFVQTLDTAPSFLMTSTNFYLDGLGSVLSSCPGSNLIWTKGIWAGGLLGG
jgi:hypothetical protein